MKKKIKDLTLKDMPKCWSKLFELNPAFMVLFTNDKKRFEYAKQTIPTEFLEQEIEVEEDE